MTSPHRVVVRSRGRVVLPAAVRSSAGLSEGTELTLRESSEGLVLLTRQQLLARVRRDLDGADLVDELLAGRRRAAAEDG
jgi:AbrB family looped-hinge helix DNA binding protein